MTTTADSKRLIRGQTPSAAFGTAQSAEIFFDVDLDALERVLWAVFFFLAEALDPDADRCSAARAEAVASGGTISFWPAARRVLMPRLFASERSARVTRSFLAIPAIVSPDFTVYQVIEMSSASGDSSIRRDTSRLVPGGTFSEYCASPIGVVLRRSSGLSA